MPLNKRTFVYIYKMRLFWRDFQTLCSGLTKTEEIKRVQDCLRLTLYRYLKSHYLDAQWKMGAIDSVLNNLIHLLTRL